MTNYPYGVSSFGFPMIGSGPVLATGNVFFVHSGTGINATGRGESPEAPFASIYYAVSKCTASKGDIVFVMEGHAESLSAATALAVAGVTIIGLGNGDNRPTVTLTGGTAAGYTIGAKNIKIANIRFLMTGITAIVAALAPGATSQYFTVEDCEFVMSTTSIIAVQAIKLTHVDASFCTIRRCRFYSPVVGATAAILSGVAHDRLRVEDCEFDGDFATAAINQTTAACTKCSFLRNIYYGDNASEPIIELYTGSTGVAAYNLSAVATLSAAGSIVGDALWKFENYTNDTFANSGILDPVGVTIG